MGKGSSPRNNHSKEWYSNYEEINWSKKVTTEELSDDQLELYHALLHDKQNQVGPRLTDDQLEELMNKVRDAFQK